MKKVILLFLALSPTIIIAQRHIKFEIQGHIEKFSPNEKVYFTHRAPDTGYIDSVITTNGNFSFKGETDISNEPEENYIGSVAWLYLDHTGNGINFDKIYYKSFHDQLIVYLEPGKTFIKIVDSVHYAKITPPKKNSGHYILDSIYVARQKKLFKSLSDAENQKLQGKRFMEFTEKCSTIYNDEEKKDLWQFVKDHPSSPVSLYILKHQDKDYYPNYKIIEPYFAVLSTELRNTAFGKQYDAMLQNLKLTCVGEAAPKFTMNDQYDKTISLSSFKGKYVLIDFWASWCSPCRAENPSVVKAYQQFKNKNFVVIGISLDQKKDSWLKAIADDKLEWVQLSDLKSWDNSVAQVYSVKAIPQNFLIDTHGKIIAKNLFGEDLIKYLDSIFNSKN